MERSRDHEPQEDSLRDVGESDVLLLTCEVATVLEQRVERVVVLAILVVLVPHRPRESVKHKNVGAKNNPHEPGSLVQPG